MTGLEIATALLRGAHVGAVLSLFGCLAFRYFVVPADRDGASASGAAGLPMAAIMRTAAISAGLALVCGGAWLAAVSVTIAGADSLAGLPASVAAVVRDTTFGRLVCLRLLLVASAWLLLRGRGPRRRVPVPVTAGAAVALVTACAAVALQPWLGHAGAVTGSEGTVPVLVEIAHLLAAGAWLGGLLPLLLCVVRAPPSAAAQLCERFTPVGLVAVGTIIVTALPQAVELIGGIAGFFGTRYGHFALIKTGLFSFALALAGVNRLMLTARLRAGARVLARRSLVASIAMEAVLGLGILLAAAAMASSVPAAHVQPVWPFAWRPGLEAWAEPELRAELVRLLVVFAVGFALIATGFILRRGRLVATVAAGALVASSLPAVTLLLVEAYPTSYATSPTGFSVGAIARGRTVFDTYCAACHQVSSDPGGVTDLAAPHLWGHRDGELFWWISQGFTDPQGNALMPAFGEALSEDDRWALIDFLHARNVGWQVRRTGRWVPPIPAPAMPLLCDGTGTTTLSALNGHILLITAGASPWARDAALLGSGVMPVRLARGTETPPSEGGCVIAAAHAWDAWSVLAGVSVDRFEGYAAIVDAQGWLRAWLPPGVGPVGAIRDARDHPVVAGWSSGAGHRH